METETDYQPVIEQDGGRWRDSAACSGTSTDDFFPEDKGGANVYLRARCLCFNCPVQQQCLQYAIDNSIYWGLWGGLSYRERLDFLKGKRSSTLSLLDIVRSSRKQETIASLAAMLIMSEDEVRDHLKKEMRRAD